MTSDKELCPMCHKQHDIKLVEHGNRYDCKPDRQYYIHDSVLNCCDVERERRLNAIFNYVEERNYLIKSGYKYYWQFYYDEKDMSKIDDVYVNVAFLMQTYPIDFQKRMDKILINLSHNYSSPADSFNLQDCVQKFRLFYCESNTTEKEISGILSMLVELNYIKRNTEVNTYDNEGARYSITVTGLKKISELQHASEMSQQAFIAMSFDTSVAYIAEAFKTAIRDAGYQPRIMNEKEHNNYIMPEIFYEIKNSRFVVVDVTEPNYGAYYEAGYAQALGKEVIVCCREDVFKGKNDNVPKPHFDIAQKSTIVWTDKNELIEKLKKRIKATVI